MAYDEEAAMLGLYAGRKKKRGKGTLFPGGPQKGAKRIPIANQAPCSYPALVGAELSAFLAWSP